MSWDNFEIAIEFSNSRISAESVFTLGWGYPHCIALVQFPSENQRQACLFILTYVSEFV